MDYLTYINKEFGSMRTILIDEEPWFVGKDVCTAFGDTHYRRSLARVPDDDKRTAPIQTKGGKQKMTIVNESGFYSLLFAMEPQRARGVTQNDARINSRIEKLERFKDWVFDDVLPTVRKYGCYPKPSIKEQIKMLSENLTSSDIDEKECYDKTYQIKRNDCRKGTNL